jgi:hypothetical protein
VAVAEALKLYFLEEFGHQELRVMVVLALLSFVIRPLIAYLVELV